MFYFSINCWPPAYSKCPWARLVRIPILRSTPYGLNSSSFWLHTFRNTWHILVDTWLTWFPTRWIWIEPEPWWLRTHNTVPITALHDSGCSKTIMSYELYKRLIPLGVAEIYQDPRYQAVRLASKEVQRIKEF